MVDNSSVTTVAHVSRVIGAQGTSAVLLLVYYTNINSTTRWVLIRATRRTTAFTPTTAAQDTCQVSDTFQPYTSVMMPGNKNVGPAGWIPWRRVHSIPR